MDNVYNKITQAASTLADAAFAQNREAVLQSFKALGKIVKAFVTLTK